MFRAKLLTTIHLEDAFYVIRLDKTTHPFPARRTALANFPHPVRETEVLCCATSIINEDGDYVAGGGIWFGINDARNISFQPNPNEQTSKITGALGALLLLIQRTPPDENLRIHLNDDNIIRNLTKRLDNNEDLDWFHVSDGDLSRALVAKLKSSPQLQY